MKMLARLGFLTPWTILVTRKESAALLALWDSVAQAESFVKTLFGSVSFNFSIFIVLLYMIWWDCYLERRGWMQHGQVLHDESNGITEIRAYASALHSSAFSVSSGPICYEGRENANIPGDFRGLTCVFAEIGER